MTQYRSITTSNISGIRYLQYRKIIRIWFISIPIWCRVPSEYYDEWMYHNITHLEHHMYVNSFSHNLDSFVKKYPDINTWFEYRTRIIEQTYNRIHQEYLDKQRNSGVKYFK